MTSQEALAYLIDAARQVCEAARERRKVDAGMIEYLERAVDAARTVKS